MKKDVHFWLTLLFRGFLALLAGSLIIIIPDMARTFLLLPFAIVITIMGLAVYGVLDSVLVLISSFMTDSNRARLGLLIQGTLGVVLGVLLLSIVFKQAQLEWFLSLAALQALSAAVGELVAARHAMTRNTTIWDYTAALIALVAGVAYLSLRIYVAAGLTAREISWLVYGFLVAFGIAQCLTAARMIYAGSEVRQFEAETTLRKTWDGY